MSKIILIAGGTGLIGKRLTTILLQKKYTVKILTRRVSPQNRATHFVWDVDNAYIDEQAFQGVSVIINLAGANIGSKRWTNRRKKEILDSRVKSTQLLWHYVQKEKISIEKFITSSAIGYYGTVTSAHVFTENDLSGADFLAHVCAQWEQAALSFKQNQIKTVTLRTGVVLSAEDGALVKMLQPIRLGVGSVLGNGQHYIPWIHVEDICQIYLWALENEKIEGIYNAVAPQHIKNDTFTHLLADLLHKKIRLPAVPKWVLQVLLGDMSVLVTEGSRVSSEKLQQAGFDFQWTDLKKALQNLLH